MKYNLSKELDAQNLRSKIEYHLAKKNTIELKKVVNKRSNPQNRYLHLILTVFAINTGYTVSESKKMYKSKYNPDIYIYEKKGTKFLRSSADLDTKEMTVSIDRFRNFVSQEFGVYIPSPDEHNFMQWAHEVENQYESAKVYL